MLSDAGILAVHNPHRIPVLFRRHMSALAGTGKPGRKGYDNSLIPLLLHLPKSLLKYIGRNLAGNGQFITLHQLLIEHPMRHCHPVLILLSGKSDIDWKNGQVLPAAVNDIRCGIRNNPDHIPFLSLRLTRNRRILILFYKIPSLPF